MTTTDATQAMLEDPDPDAPAILALYSWSLNYDPGKGPFLMFADIVGFSVHEFGHQLFDYDTDWSWGYVELGYMARAMKEFVDEPARCQDYLEDLIRAECE